jgi:hypothetical protein
VFFGVLNLEIAILSKCNKNQLTKTAIAAKGEIIFLNG